MYTFVSAFFHSALWLRDSLNIPRVRVSNTSHLRQYLVMSVFLILAILAGVWSSLMEISICILPMTNKVKHLFMFVDYLDILSCERPVQILCLFPFGLSVFFLLIYRSTFYITAKSPLLNMCILNIFHTVACMFTLLMVYFDKHKVLILKKTNLAFFLFMGSVLSSLRNIGLH